jgi:hypothetical protein
MDKFLSSVKKAASEAATNASAAFNTVGASEVARKHRFLSAAIVAKLYSRPIEQAALTHAICHI